MDEQIKNIFNYLEMARRHKWILIISFVVCTVAATALSFYMPVFYRSSTMILVERQQVPEKYVMPTDKTPFSDRLNTISQQIMSRSKLEEVLHKLDIYDTFVKDMQDNPMNMLRRKLGLGGKQEVPTESVIEEMRRRVDIKVIGGRRGGGDAFKVSFIGRDPRTTMRVTNTLASLFISENIRVRSRYVAGTTNFIEAELAKAKKSLESQEKHVRDFKEKYMGSLPAQIDANLKTLDRLQMNLQSNDKAIASTREKISSLQDQIGMENLPSPDGKPRNSAVMAVEGELARMHTRLSSLLSVYKEDYPDVILLRNRIKNLEVKLEQARSRASQSNDVEDQSLPFDTENAKLYADLKATDAELVSLMQDKAGIERQIKVYEKRVEDTPANEQKLTELRRDYDISLKNYQSLLEKKLSSKLAENLEERQKGERFRIMDPAYLPVKPYKTYKRSLPVFGAIFGLGIGLGIVLLMEFARPTYRKPGELTEEFGLPVLSVISNLHSRHFAGAVKGSGAKPT